MLARLEEETAMADRLTTIADRLLAARRQGARIQLTGPDLPKDFEEGFAIQDKVVAALEVSRDRLEGNGGAEWSGDLCADPGVGAR